MRKILLITFVLFAVPFVGNAANDHVWINQVQVEGDNGATDEFIELFNPTTSPISINGWSIQYKSASGNFPLTTAKKNLPDATIPALGYFLIAQPDYNGSVIADHVQSTISLSGTSNGATIFLVSDTNFLVTGTDATIVDKLGYGTSSTNSPETANAPSPASEKSLQRNGSDTDDNSLDFSTVDSNPHNLASTPAAPTPTPVPPPAPVPTPTPTSVEAPQYSSDVLISEIFPNPDGRDDGEEWIELYNPSVTDVDLSGWVLDDEAVDSSIGNDAYVFMERSMIPAHAYLAVNLLPENFALNNTSGDTVRLFWPNKQMSRAVHYSDTAKEDESYAMKSQDVYEWTTKVSRGVANQFTEVVVNGITSSASLQIKISEIFPNPRGVDSGREWVELINMGLEPIYLHNWILDDGDMASPIGATAWKIPSPIVPPLGFAVLMIPAGKFALNNTSDTIRLFNENQVLIDQINYQDSQEEQSYAQIDGNWTWGEATPNADNVVAAETKAALPNIVINELFPEPIRGSLQEEFIELKNLGDTEIDLSRFEIADLATSYTLKSVIKPGEFLVIKKSESNISFNNTGSETVTLTDAQGQLIASVAYEDAPVNQSYNLTADGTYAWSTVLTLGTENKIVALSKIQPSQAKIVTKSSDTQNSLPGAVVELEPLLDGQVSGTNIDQPQEPNPLKNLWLWLLGSFALNLVFCYSLVRLMIQRSKL